MAWEVSGASLILPTFNAISDGNYQTAGIYVAAGLVDVGPLFRTFGKGFTKVATEIAEKFTVAEVWALKNNLLRGILVEAKLAAKYTADGLEWMAKHGVFFPTFDFFDATKKLAVSLKSVNASANFTFQKHFG